MLDAISGDSSLFLVFVGIMIVDGTPTSFGLASTVGYLSLLVSLARTAARSELCDITQTCLFLNRRAYNNAIDGPILPISLLGVALGFSRLISMKSTASGSYN